VLGLILSPRWILWHVLTLGAMVTCGFLAAWQWRRAGSALGSAVNVGYGLQWPVFALFFGVIWWRMLRIELAKVSVFFEESATTEPSAAAPPTSSRSPFAYRPPAMRPVTDAEDPELAEYNRMLAALAARDPHPQD